ncbi:MAG: type III pantothenate kinase [Rhodospirillales bacterium]|nr:type III pantothenate kinase [Rhodospirillales bacterium]
MLLAIDSGNTNVVFAVCGADGGIVGEWRAETAANWTADEFGIWLCRLIETDGIKPGDIDAAIIATVVPDNLAPLRSMCEKYFKSVPIVVGEAGVDLGLNVMIDHPGEVGTDRLCNAVAGKACYGGPLLILDFGTATTFDVVDADGNYRGGVIYPGINLSLEALHLGAAQLPRVEIIKPDKVIGTGTVSAMQSGIFWGHVAIVEGLSERIQTEFGSRLSVIATGGHASLFAEATETIEKCDPELTLRGLYLIHERNRT